MKKNNDFDDALNFELMKSVILEKSERRAWIVAYVFGICFILSVIGIVLMLPLKKEIPFLINVDKAGNTEIVSFFNEKNITFNEALSKHDVYRYIKLRESYFWATLNNDFELVQVFSSNDIKNDFIKEFYKESNLYKTFSSNVEVNVEVNSIVLSQAGDGSVIAVSRIKKFIFDKFSKTTKEENYIVNLTFIYDVNKIMKEKFRIENPLGFTITHYRKDKEIH